MNNGVSHECLYFIVRCELFPQLFAVYEAIVIAVNGVEELVQRVTSKSDPELLEGDDAISVAVEVLDEKLRLWRQICLFYHFA